MSHPAHQAQFVAAAVDWFVAGFDAGHGNF
jgi:hypothetical protein